MITWGDIGWLVGGALVGAPISSAMTTLPSSTGRGVSLKRARQYARSVTDWRIWPKVKGVFADRSRTRTARTDEDVWGGLLFFTAGILMALRLYAENVVGIAVVLFWGAVLTLVITVVVFLVLLLRHVFDGKATAWALLSTVPYAALGSLTAYWLVEPPLHGVVELAQTAVADNGLLGILPFTLPLGLQALGALSSFVLLFWSIAVCTANVAAALIAQRAWGATWLWRFVFWCGRWSTGQWTWAGFIILAAFAGLSSSGLLTEWMYAIQAEIESSVPA